MRAEHREDCEVSVRWRWLVSGAGDGAGASQLECLAIFTWELASGHIVWCVLFVKIKLLVQNHIRT